ncbi:MAG: glycosyltransferase family 39 protein [Dokdonella sp.]|nr:glycosyltransferase family 39 protein [Dokdonella sp.]
MGGPFVFDDYPALVNNPRLHVTDFSFDAFARAALSFDAGGGSRPLAMASFAFNHALGGLDPWGYKLFGVVVHAINALLVFALVLRLLGLVQVGEQHRRVAAFAIALLWAVHPLQISTVLYVVQRMETLSLTFVLMALLAYLRGRALQIAGSRGWPWFVACLPLIGLGLACKETAVLFLAYALALEWTVLRFETKEPAYGKLWRRLYLIGTVLALLVFVLIAVPRYGSLETFTGRDFNSIERVLSQLRILPLYLGQMLWPVPGSMTFYYDDFLPSRSVLSPISTLFGGLVLVGLLASAWLLRQRAPLYALGIFWFFAAHLLTSNVLSLELVFEHRNYFALLGILLAAADLVRRIPVEDGPAIKYAGAAALILGVGALGVLRAATWGDKLLLATDLAARNPSSARAAHELGVTYYEMTDGYTNSPFFGFAQKQFEREAGLPSASILGEQALILMASAAKQPADPALWDGLIEKLRERPITPQTTQGLFALLDNRLKGASVDDLKLTEAFMVTFDRVTFPPNTYASFGDYLLEQVGNVPLANLMIAKAIDESRHYPGYAARIVNALRSRGHDEQADLALSRARELGLEVAAPIPATAPATSGAAPAPGS